MEYNQWFDTDENKNLMAICARKLIRNIGIGGIIWGVFNVVIGVVAIQATMINAGILILGVLMLGAGVRALKKPSLDVLLIEIIVTVLLFLWNLGISIFNSIEGAGFNPQGLIFPMVIAGVFVNHYRKLGHLRTHIGSMDSEKIEMTTQVCKTLLKKKLKEESRIIQTTDRKCRVQLMAEQAFFIQRDLMRAFVCSKRSVQVALIKPDAKALKMGFEHPLGTLKYQFDRKNSDKLKSWLSEKTDEGG